MSGGGDTLAATLTTCRTISPLIIADVHLQDDYGSVWESRELVWENGREHGIGMRNGWKYGDKETGRGAGRDGFISQKRSTEVK